MTLNGKGFMIWKVHDCEGANPYAIASQANSAGLTHVLIKIADGINPYNILKKDGDPPFVIDLIAPVVKALHNFGIQAWGWHYVYGSNPKGEAQIAIERVLELDLDGYVIDAESEYKLPGREDNADIYMKELRDGIPNVPVALCSYRYPSYHPQLPWKTFLSRCDLNMPQVYWEKAHNPGAQLKRCVKEFQAMEPKLPIVPTGPAYLSGDWRPTAADTTEFLDTARSLGLTGANFFAWEYARTLLKPVWEAMSNFSWNGAPTSSDITKEYISALNTHDPAIVASLFRPEAVHITSEKTIQGIAAIQKWYTTLLSTTLPKATFKLVGSSGSGNSRHCTWEATSSKGNVLNGNDTFGLLEGKIAYHYSLYKIIGV